MIILKKPGEAYAPVDLAPGARVFVRPATSYDFEAAKQAFAKASKAASDTSALASLYGLPFADSARDSADAVAGLHQAIFWTEMAALCISRWEGICNETGQLLPVDRPTIALLMTDQGYHLALVAAMALKLHEVRSEGNASAASRHGEPEAATDTAPIASAMASPAPTALQ
jgi:hypothetical protein